MMRSRSRLAIRLRGVEVLGWVVIIVGAWGLLAVFGLACCAAASHADDRMMRRYQRERQAFEDLFE